MNHSVNISNYCKVAPHMDAYYVDYEYQYFDSVKTENKPFQ